MPSGLDPDLVTAGVNHGRVRRPIAVAKALDDVILAYEMNGEPLLPDPGMPAAWQRWEFRWRTPSPGSYTLRARATDVTGATQPASVPGNTFGYHFGGIGEHPVSTALPQDPRRLTSYDVRAVRPGRRRQSDRASARGFTNPPS
jgi:Oxidoreductase molybdopterin binding domain